MKRCSSLLTGTVAAALVLPLVAPCTGAAGAPPTPPGSRPDRGPLAGVVVTIPPSSPQLRRIRTETVGTADIPGEEIVAPGRLVLDPRRVARVSLPVPGRIDRVAVHVGDAVRAGQTLLTFDSPEAAAAAAESRGAQASRRQAAAALRRAQADLDRLRDLFDHKAVAQKDVLRAEEELVQAQGAHEQADAACAQTDRRLEMLGLAAGKARQQIVVRSPLAGKVLEVSVAAGEYRNDTTIPVMTVADLSTVLVSSDVPERDIRLVEPGEGVSVDLVAYPGEVFEARVTRISDNVDARTRTVQVQAEISNPKGRLRPEMYGRVRHSHHTRPMAVVPAQALVQASGGSFVYVERGRGVFERAAVVATPAPDGKFAIARGVRPGDRVVVDGAMLLLAQTVGGGQ